MNYCQTTIHAVRYNSESIRVLDTQYILPEHESVATICTVAGVGIMNHLCRLRFNRRVKYYNMLH